MKILKSCSYLDRNRYRNRDRNILKLSNSKMFIDSVPSVPKKFYLINSRKKYKIYVYERI